MIFGAQQEKVIQEAITWYKDSSEQTFQIMGEAGTGKSVVINEIIRRLGLRENQYMAMAYTGQAAIVMRLKGFPYAKSIHSSLYHFDYIAKTYNDHPVYNTEYNIPETQMVFKLKDPRSIPSSVSLFVIDEGYPVPKDMRAKIESFGRKVLVGGDSGQLPPVAGEPTYFVDGNIHILTEIMRQAEGNPIVYLAHRARRGLPIHCGIYGNNALVIEDRDLTPEMLNTFSTVVCGTNATRDIINNYVRGTIKRIPTPFPVFGDRVICRNNNWMVERDNISLANGLVGTVMSMPDPTTFDGHTIDIDFVPDLGNVVFEDTPIDYKYLISDASERRRMKNLPYKNGEKFEYAYALTGYLAQGAEYPSGMYIEEFLRPEIQNQLNYTGITRFRNYLLYVKKSKSFQIFLSGK